MASKHLPTIVGTFTHLRHLGRNRSRCREYRILTLVKTGDFTVVALDGPELNESFRSCLLVSVSHRNLMWLDSFNVIPEVKIRDELISKVVDIQQSESTSVHTDRCMLGRREGLLQ
jgi:hypothetical protein